jgi:translation initiation factor eIF-2B subunit beta
LLKRRQITGSESCAIATAHILRQVVAKGRWHDEEQLLETVQKAGKRLVEAQPKELVIGNITMRVLGLIRDEAEENRNDGDGFSEAASETPMEMEPTMVTAESAHTIHKHHESQLETTEPRQTPLTRPPTLTSFSSYTVPKTLFHILAADPMDPSDSGRTSGVSTPARHHPTKIHALRSEIIDGIEEIMDEIGQVDEQIAASAEAQIHPGDYVMVYQPSRTLTKFILKAASRRKFTLFVVGEPPRKPADEPDFKSFREKLEGAGIDAITVASTKIMAYMPRVNKVILTARAVVANGGVLVSEGAGAIARAAKTHGKPVVVLSGVYRLSPQYVINEKSLIEWGSASTFVKFSDGKMVNGVGVKSAITAFLRPELVDIYITNL